MTKVSRLARSEARKFAKARKMKWQLLIPEVRKRLKEVCGSCRNVYSDSLSW